ncbi:MAG TPA: DUF4349 domain-containing protein [Pyrinomonadaceae bacterium]|nr:DUF4349 domain-containing protein [Pyrinomonadaceae bacterium]
MKLFKTTLLAAALAASLACSSRSGDSASYESVPQEQRGVGGASTAPGTQTAAPPGAREEGSAGRLSSSNANTARQDSSGSVTTMVKDQAAPAVTERRIIRNAALTVDVENPVEGQRKIASAAEQFGGYVVTSDSRLQSRAGDAKSFEVVTVEVRVPFQQFDAMLGAIRGVGGRVREEKITGQDVTEEYVDLEARVRSQKALEAQIMEIMKRANDVSDALEVQSQLAAVRTEIERLEGRRRFLENQSSLSTIKVTLQPPSPFVEASTTGFMAEVKDAFGDGFDFGAALLLGLIRVVIALVPVVLFIFLPFGLLARYLLRRYRRRRLADQLRSEPAAETR